jgi:hypothetical protein
MKGSQIGSSVSGPAKGVHSSFVSLPYAGPACPVFHHGSQFVYGYHLFPGLYISSPTEAATH